MKDKLESLQDILNCNDIVKIKEKCIVLCGNIDTYVSEKVNETKNLNELRTRNLYLSLCIVLTLFVVGSVSFSLYIIYLQSVGLFCVGLVIVSIVMLLLVFFILHDKLGFFE